MGIMGLPAWLRVHRERVGAMEDGEFSERCIQ
jgi:hypothetical protein